MGAARQAPGRLAAIEIPGALVGELMERNVALYAARGYAETERRREKGFCRVFMAKRLNRA